MKGGTMGGTPSGRMVGTPGRLGHSEMIEATPTKRGQLGTERRQRKKVRSAALASPPAESFDLFEEA